jgi:hypothetical protein
MTNTKRKPFTPTEAKIIGNKLGMNWEQFDLKQFRLGLNAELADGAYNPMTDFASEDPILIGKIARAHLTENPDYYTEWAQMEKDAAHDTSHAAQ